jgi:lysozyme
MNFSRLKESVKANEGFRDRVYKDTLGFDTIGYGFAIKNLLVEEDIAGIILERKLFKLITDIYTRLPWVVKMPPKIEEVVVEMCYQLGIGGFSKFKKTIAFLKYGDFEKAAEEMLDSRWAKQTPNRAKGMSEVVKGI